MKPVVVYTTTYCTYCRMAKSLLEKEGVPYTEVDVTDDDERRQWLVEKTGRRTVPQIFFGDDPVGGYDDLNALTRAGQLHDKLNAPA